LNGIGSASPEGRENGYITKQSRFREASGRNQALVLLDPACNPILFWTARSHHDFVPTIGKSAAEYLPYIAASKDADFHFLLQY
jgi:hypothetical protein